MKGRVRKSRESIDMRWFPINELPERMGFDHARIIADARKSMGA